MTSFNREYRDDIRSLMNRFAHSLDGSFCRIVTTSPTSRKNRRLRWHLLHRLLSLARCSLCAEGDDGVDGRGSAGWEIAGEERNQEKEQRDAGDGREIAGGEAEEHFGD